MGTSQTSQAPSALLDVFKQIDFEPVRGDGVWLHGANGDRYLDFYGGHAVASLGNAHPRLQSVLAEQAGTLFFQSNVVRLEVRERAAARLVRFGPPNLVRAFFVNSGAEANENALRIAFLATKRRKVVCVAGGFHGRTAAVSAITDGHERWYGFPQKNFDVQVVPFDDTVALERAIDNDTAAFIVEPVQGIAGARQCSAAFLETARRRTSEAGAVLILDEVQCGMGRTGYPFAAQAYDVAPDILTAAKGIAGGFPAGAVIVTEAMARAVTYGDLGTTFGGGPLACALIETVIDVIERENLLDRVRRLSLRLQNECCVGPVTSVQGMGFLLGLRTTRPAAEVLAQLRARRILAGSATDPNVVRLLPPLVLDDDHVTMLVHALEELGTS